MCSSTFPFNLAIPVQVSIHEAVLGFHTKASPCFKAKLVFIRLLNPEREFTLTVFFLMAPHASRKSFEIHLGIHQAAAVDDKSEIGGEKFLCHVDRDQPAWSFHIQGHLF